MTAIMGRMATYSGKMIEWDEAITPGLDATGYAIQEGRVSVPAAPGFGLALDSAHFAGAVNAGGEGTPHAECSHRRPSA